MTAKHEAAAMIERRRSVRVEVKPLVYASKAVDGPPILLDLSVGGMSIQAMHVLERGDRLEFEFALTQGATEVAGVAEIVWTDITGRAGVKFAALSGFDRARLHEWVVQNQIN
jgi:hypothetical protein